MTNHSTSLLSISNNIPILIAEMEKYINQKKQLKMDNKEIKDKLSQWDNSRQKPKLNQNDEKGKSETEAIRKTNQEIRNRGGRL